MLYTYIGTYVRKYIHMHILTKLVICIYILTVMKIASCYVNMHKCKHTEVHELKTSHLVLPNRKQHI